VPEAKKLRNEVLTRLAQHELAVANFYLDHDRLKAAAGRLRVPTLGWAFYFRWIIPLACMYAVSLAASNIAAQRLSVSFIQMIKAVTPLVRVRAPREARAGRLTYSLPPRASPR
jgi:hypothetical protein